MADIYATPQAPLEQQDVSAENNWGSLEKGQAGQYQFSIGDILKEAWEKTPGAKLPINLVGLTYLLAAGILTFLLSLILGNSQGAQFLINNVIVPIVIIPMGAALLIMGIRRAVGAPLSYSIISKYYGMIIPLVICYFLTMIFVILGMILLIIPGIYISVALTLATPLVADKKISPMQAILISRRAIHHKWFPVFGFLIVIGLINFFAALLLLVGLIWTVPMTVIAMGIFYRNVFGCSPETRA